MSNIDDKLNEVLNIAEEVLDKKEEKNPLEIINEMEGNKKDPTNLDEVLAWLKLYYNLDES